MVGAIHASGDYQPNHLAQQGIRSKSYLFLTYLMPISESIFNAVWKIEKIRKENLLIPLPKDTMPEENKFDVENPRLTESQKDFVSRYKNMVGDILDELDGAFSDVVQRKAVKKKVQSVIYTFGLEFLEDYVK